MYYYVDGASSSSVFTENLQHNEDYFPGHDRMIVGFTITYAISAYHH